MAFQGGRDIYVNFKEQTTYGTAEAAGVGATRFRVNEGSPGMNLSKASINSNENRGDGMSTRGRHGSHIAQGSYGFDMSLGTHDAIYEAVMRGTWAAAATFSDGDGAGGLTVSSNVISFATGGLATLGKLAPGDVMTFTSGVDAADQNKRLMVVAATDTTATVLRSDGVALTDVGSAATTYSATVHRKLIQGTTRRLFTVEEHEVNIDKSELFDSTRFTRLDIGVTADNMAVATVGAFGRTVATFEDANAPYFTGEEPSTTLGLTATDMKLVIGGTELVDITDFQLSIDLRGSGTPVVGSNYTPDIFENNAQVTGRITGIREDFTRFGQFLNETKVDLFAMFRENEDAPEDFLAVSATNMTLGAASKAPIGNDGPRTQSFDLMIGAEDAGGIHDKTMVKFVTSAA